jgi:hypothetical protein
VILTDFRLHAHFGDASSSSSHPSSARCFALPMLAQKCDRVVRYRPVCCISRVVGRQRVRYVKTRRVHIRHSEHLFTKFQHSFSRKLPHRRTRTRRQNDVDCQKCLLNRNFKSERAWLSRAGLPLEHVTILFAVAKLAFFKGVWSTECVPTATDCIARFGEAPFVDSESRMT